MESVRRGYARFAVGSQSWVVVLAEAEGLRWVLRERKMAWTVASARRAQRIQPTAPFSQIAYARSAGARS